MKKALKAVLATVGLIAGLMVLGGPESNVADFSWFGRVSLAMLVCIAAFRLRAMFNPSPSDNPQKERL